ncbi:uncharacterized protein LTR77_006001 [Saxophila tyrrhenica]|uniref:Uncharacterized protein n=1 Tax=Saxophila tyrrhenica TaxID=1690608 RepID=A0AAV9PAM4_9PEZI|nr:hypothetical protein LTR77_006001 [Saxophila tyrrhenica]
MAMFRYYMDMHIQNMGRGGSRNGDALVHCADRCILSAKRIIEVTWYNSTYIMMAAAALLSYITRGRTSSATMLKQWVEMAMEILDAMEESAVARKCAEILKKHLTEVADLDAGGMLPATAGVTVPNGGEYGYMTGDVLSDQENFNQILDFSFGDMASLFQGFNDIGS